jgi:hypothetical protein
VVATSKRDLETVDRPQSCHSIFRRNNAWAENYSVITFDCTSSANIAERERQIQSLVCSAKAHGSGIFLSRVLLRYQTRMGSNFGLKVSS